MIDFIPSPNADISLLGQFNQDMDVFTCPCCKRLTAIYKRTLHKTIIQQLVNLYIKGGSYTYIHSDNFITGTVGKDFGIAKHWGLIERESNNDPRKKTTGKWRLTILGLDFIASNADIPKYAYLYNDTLQGVSVTKVSIKECMGQEFDYSQLTGQQKLF